LEPHSDVTGYREHGAELTQLRAASALRPHQEWDNQEVWHYEPRESGASLF